MDRIVLWGIIVIAIIVIGRRLYRYLYNNAQPERSLAVLVVDKSTRQFMGQTRQEETELPAPTINYYVTFRPQQGGQEQQFHLSQPLYSQIQTGQTGTLIFKGSRFIAFTLDND